MNVIQKNATVSTVESENPNGEFEVILSTEAKDRDNENLWAHEWKTPLPDRIHIDGDHGRSLDKTVGSAVPRLEGNTLVAKGTFASTPYAQMVRQLVNEGHINSLSVTYSESKDQKGEGVQRELLNAAFVAIPANPEAVVLASKNAKVDRQVVRDELARLSEEHPTVVAKWVGEQLEKRDKADGGLSASGDNPQVPPKHDEMVQAIHDAACHLGAMCLNEIDAQTGAADGANKNTDAVITKEEARKDFDLTKSSSPEAGTPSESADESAVSAAAEKSAAAETADNSADDAARQKQKQLEMGRGTAYLIKMNTLKEA